MSLSRNAALTFLSLLLASLICVGLVFARIYRTGQIGYAFLVWNLFLAWVPLVYAAIAYGLHKSRLRNMLVIALCAGVWMLFLPNAPYILTDLIHFRVVDNALFWYDLLLFLWFGWTGLLLAFVSLGLMQRVVAESFGPLAGWAFAIASLGLTGFGVYLGRFLRWNSWDILSDPLALLADIYVRFRHPLEHFHTHAFSLLLAALLICVYVTFMTFSPLSAARQTPKV